MKRTTVLICLLGLGCDNPTAPPVRPPNAVDVTLEYCASSAPMWVAYKNDGYDWVRVPHAPFQSTFTFWATSRLTIAVGRGSRDGSSTVHVVNLAASEVQHIRCQPPVPGPNTMTGTARAPDPFDRVFVSTGLSATGIVASIASYQLAGLPAGTFDLVATLSPATNAREPLVIVRHDVSSVDAGTIPVLDFTGPEALPYATASITAQNVEAGAHLFASVDFRSARGATTFISGQGLSRTGTVMLRSIDASRLRAGDAHRVRLALFSDGLSEVTYLTREVRDTAIAFGPSLPDPTIQRIDDKPFQRFSVRLLKLAEYSSVAEASFGQRGGDTFHWIVVATTAAFAGDSLFWELDLPDLERAPDFPMRWGMQPHLPVFIEIEASSARFPVHIGREPQAPSEVIRRATAKSFF